MGSRARIDSGSPASAADRCRIHAVLLLLKARRIEQGLTQDAVSKAMGITQSGVSEMESLHNSDIEVGTLLRYARAVGARLEIDVVEESR